ncbi:hypothetical protein P5673_030723 [Acropora cervicornis]|uniref:Uncharacterized protein n=1 Tax=Acropora cervicornis TaxID=6130 RepID=A0AAD9UT25_ACRCE|nr:hypothetical protein P5673_030723 [Acropora cervicornis]
MARNAASRYAMIDLYDSVDRACYPEDLGRFVQSTESISTSGNASKGEDMDACLEEVNKDSKVWQHGSMVAMDWLRIFRNLENLSKVRNWLFSIIGLKNPKDEAADSQRKYDFQDEILAWRIKLRKEKSDVSIQTLFVTAEERAVAEDIKNSSKDEILRRVLEKIQQISDEEIREPLSQKLDHLRKNINKSKKENLVIFYNEILEELQQSQAQQETAYVVEEEGQSFKIHGRFH